MQHFIYPENQYKHIGAHGKFTVDYDHESKQFKFKDSDGPTKRIPAEAAAMLAGFILSNHPAIVKGDAMAFSLVTRACDAIHEPDFTVITPTNGLRATTKAQDGDGDDQDVEVTVTSPGPLSARRAGKEFAEQLSKVWFDKDDTLKEPDTQDDEQDTGDLHPDQERRLTALREASEILGGRLYHDQLIECAGWILDGDTSTN